MLAALFFAAVAQVPTPTPGAHLKVLVLEVASTDMTESERTTLMNVETALLSEDPRLEVQNGDDLKQLVKLQGQAQEFDLKGNCADACMAELAGALGAGLVISTQVGKLGDSFVVTVVLFDAAKAKSVGRRSVNAASLGELPQKLGPALLALMQPLLNAGSTPSTPPPSPTTTPPVTRSTLAANAARARLQELYGIEAMQICFDKDDRKAWWFCNRKQAFTENAFVREYRALTGAHDVDHGEVGRTSAGEILAPVGPFTLAAVGAAGLGFLGYCRFSEACGPDVGAVVLADDPNLPLLAFSLGGVTMLIGGALAGIEALGAIDSDGTPRTHVLSEAEGRGAAFRYNDALRIKLATQLGN